MNDLTGEMGTGSVSAVSLVPAPGIRFTAQKEDEGESEIPVPNLAVEACVTKSSRSRHKSVLKADDPVAGVTTLEAMQLTFVDLTGEKISDGAFLLDAHLLFRDEYHRFLMEFSVLPGKSLAIVAHFVPIRDTSDMID